MEYSDKKYILYAEDDNEDQELLRDMLKKINADVKLLTVRDGVEGLNFLRQLRSEDSYPCLIIFDINMPKLNGIETLKILKDDVALKHLPVIIFTTATDELVKQKAKMLGAEECITKPITLQSFKEVASHFVDRCESNESFK